MTSPQPSRTAGELNAAISEAVVRLYSECAGRGPTKARTIHNGKLVLCVLEDTMTKAERTLASAGEEDFVPRMRQTIQEIMRTDMAAAVEGFTQRTVVAFMSANHVEPDLAAEVFVRDEPLSETEMGESE